MEEKYIVDIYTSHRVEVWADDKNEARKKADEEVLKRHVNYARGDMVIGYKIKKFIKTKLWTRKHTTKKWRPLQNIFSGWAKI